MRVNKHGQSELSL